MNLTNSKHTPGPWRFEPRDGFRPPYVVRGKEGGFAVLGRSPDQEDADARLIAAAPELLDALRQWAWAEENNDAAELANARFSRDTALTKATGEKA